MSASRRDIAAAVAAEIEQGPMWQAANFYKETSEDCLARAYLWPTSTVARLFHVHVQDLERVLRGRKASRS